MFGNYELIARYLGPNTVITQEREFRHQYGNEVVAARITTAKKSRPRTNHALADSLVAQHRASVDRHSRQA